MQVHFHGTAVAKYGRTKLLSVPQTGCTVAALHKLAGTDSKLIVSIDDEVAGADQLVRPDQRVDIFTPLSGG